MTDEQRPGVSLTMDLNDPQFRNAVLRLHHLGSRVLGEFLIELAQSSGGSASVEARLAKYAGMATEYFGPSDGDNWPTFIFPVDGDKK